MDNDAQTCSLAEMCPCSWCLCFPHWESCLHFFSTGSLCNTVHLQVAPLMCHVCVHARSSSPAVSQVSSAAPMTGGQPHSTEDGARSGPSAAAYFSSAEAHGLQLDWKVSF